MPWRSFRHRLATCVRFTWIDRAVNSRAPFRAMRPTPFVMGTRLMAKFIFFLLLAVVSGCGGTQNQAHEITGTVAERIAGVSRVVESNTPLPSTIADAHLIELQFGDGQLGPADFRSFVWMKVSPDDVAKWKAGMKTPPIDSPNYDAPPSQPRWWLAESTFTQLTKYDSQAFFGRHGWVVIQDDGNIYALTYTQ